METVKLNKKLNPRKKTQEATDKVKKTRDSENSERRDFPITVNTIRVTENRKARKRKT